MERTPYNIALLDIFLQAMGEGFAKNVLCFEGNGGLDPNNFKQKVSKMREGNIKQAKEVRDSVSIGLRRFIDGAATDSTEKYCREEGSDKYTNFFRGLWLPLDFPLKKILPENFFYEENEAVLAYQVAQWLVKSCEKEAGCSIDPRDVPGYQTLTLEDRKKYDEQVQQVFRPEYYSALWDVVEHGAGNKTFYKWPIDELYKECDEQKQKIDEIIRYVFWDNDGNVSSTFKKLKDELGVRRWTTFDKLFQNELKDDKLKAKLQDDNLLEKYQVFQSRMINAFVLENLRAILPEKIGDDLAEKVFKSLFRHVKGEPVDLKAEFLVPDHDRKTKEYKEAVENLIDESNYEELKRKLENLDKDCPATVFFKDFVKIINGHAHFYFRLSSDDVESMKDEARKNIRYLGDFHRYNFNSWENLREEFF